MLSQEELLAKKIKKYICLFGKSQKMYKERDVVKSAWKAVTLGLHFIEDVTQFIS